MINDLKLQKFHVCNGFTYCHLFGFVIDCYTYLCDVLLPNDNQLPNGKYDCGIMTRASKGTQDLQILIYKGLTGTSKLGFNNLMKRGFFFHTGNTLQDTKGCPLYGYVTNNASSPLCCSKIARDKVFSQLSSQMISLTIEDLGTFDINPNNYPIKYALQRMP